MSNNELIESIVTWINNELYDISVHTCDLPNNTLVIEPEKLILYLNSLKTK